MRIALVGSPNCGKTTLFNLLTGSKYQTVNYPGATVEYAQATLLLPSGEAALCMDTPGLPSLQALSADERVTLSALYDVETRPDLVVAVADSTQLSRHLYLVRQLQEVGFNTLLVLTMADQLKESGHHLDLEQLQDHLGLPVLMVDPRQSSSRDQVLDLMAFCLGTGHAEVLQDPASHIAQHQEAQIQAHYREIDRILANVLSQKVESKEEWPWDRLLLHPYGGLGVFLVMMAGLYSAIFWLAAPLTDAVDGAFAFSMDFLTKVLPEHWLSALLTEGVVGGLGAMAVFIPQIVILFVILGILEDSGYLARGAALIDRPLAMIGLNGRAFVPLLSGHACAIPAMMAARTIPGRFERLLTMGIIPLMTCSARIPVFFLLVSFLTPADKPWLGGIVMTGIYVLGIVLGALVATLIHRFAGAQRNDSFVLELPTLRRPIAKVLLASTWHKTKSYVQKATGTIVIISVVLWALVNFGPQSFDHGQYSKPEIEHSYAAGLGHVLEPVMEPMGLDWRGGVALISGFAAREVFVSSMALVYRVDEQDDEGARTQKLMQTMSTATHEDGSLIFSFSTCMGLILFYMVALQCFPTVATARAESGSWKFALGQLGVMTGGAWILTVALVQGLRILGIQ